MCATNDPGLGVNIGAVQFGTSVFRTDDGRLTGSRASAKESRQEIKYGAVGARTRMDLACDAAMEIFAAQVRTDVRSARGYVAPGRPRRGGQSEYLSTGMHAPAQQTRRRPRPI